MLRHRKSRSVSSLPYLHPLHTTPSPKPLQSAWRYIQLRDFKAADVAFASAVELSADSSTEELLALHKEIAKMWMRVYSVSRALPHLRHVKNYAEQSGQTVEKMEAYKDLGTCYHLVRRYQTSLLYFKKLLELAWYHDNLEMELEAYDNMAKQYYYLGSLDKAAYYNNRAWKGIVERKDAPARQIAANAYEARRKPRLHFSSNGALIRPISRNSSDLSNTELPSPINNSTSGVKSQLLHRGRVKLPVLKRKGGVGLQKGTEQSTSFILISHLSLNRSLKNYQCMKDAKKVK